MRAAVLAHLTSMLRRLAGIAVLALLLAGVPYALVHLLGSALPQQIPDAGQITAALTAPLSDEILGGLLVAVLWVAWAAFAWSVVTEFAAVFTGIRLPQPKAFAPTRGLAALLVAAITGGVLATAAQAAPPYGAAQAATPATATVPAVVAQQHSAPAGASAVQDWLPASTAAVTKTMAEQVKLKAAGKQYTHTVRPGDSLSVIAKQWLGDANRWPEIFALNRGQHFTAPAGTLKNPQVIRAGWTLQLPDDATPPAGAKPDAPADQPAPDSPAEPATETPAGPGDQPGETASGEDAPQVGDDGVIDDDTDSSEAGGPGDAGDEQPDSGEDERQAPAGSVTGVDLPSGSWVDVGLVAALLAAVALVWAHRQRRFQRRPLRREFVDDPMPPVVRHVRRGLRRSAVTALDDNGRRELHAYREFFDGIRAAGDNETTRHRINGTAAFTPFIPATRPSDTAHLGTEANDEPGQPHDKLNAAPGRHQWAHEPRHRRDPDEQLPGDLLDGNDLLDDNDLLDEDLLDDEDILGVGPVDVRRLLNDAPPPVTPALANPVAPAWPAAGIGLVGPGADAAARGFLVAALAAGGIGDFDARSTVVIPAATLTTLLGADAIIMPQTPRLTVTAGLSEALNLIEEQTLHRSRLLYEHEVEDALALRETDPMAEPISPLVLIADVTAEHERARIAALLTQSQRLDIHGVLLGAWPHGDTVDVGIDGSTLPASGSGRRRRHLADLGRLTVFTFAEAADLLRLLAESHTGQPQPTPPTSRTDTTIDPLSVSPTDDGLRLFPDLAGNSTPAEHPAAGTHQDLSPPEPAHEETSAAPSDDSIHTDATTADEPIPSTLVTVEAFGKPRIVDTPADERVRPQAVELLVYLAVRGGTASQDDILEDLLPEVTAKTAPHRLHTFTSNLRRIAGLIAGGGTFLTVERKQYRLHRAAFDIDLWRLQDAVAEAAGAGDPAQQIAALRRAVDAYTAPLADTSRGYDWAEPYRENIRRQALNAALTLADLLDDHDQALTVLGTAMTHHPHAEDLYRCAMRRHGQRGDLDAVRQTHRTLTQALEELDAEPSDETIELLDDLLAGQRRRPRPAASTDRGRPR
jgi:DNA-binding SARP family transcriptional activator/LysM repeat protein